MSELSYLYQKPMVTAVFKQHVDDFFVDEILPFEPFGEGEHFLLQIKKTNANTHYVVKQLAQFFNVPNKVVSYAGLKDRFGVTQQWFSIQLPGVKSVDLSNFHDPDIEIIGCYKHNKKLKTGALAGNRFVITLREVSNPAELTARWQQIVTSGVPNYFGEQRFGYDDHNIEQALAMFNGKKIKDRNKRSIYLSAARSWIFNHIVSERINNQQFSELLDGDVCMLAGTQSIFNVDQVEPSLIQRLAEADIDITAPMWGRGELKTTATVADFEQAQAHQHQALCTGLEQAGLKQERRRIRLMPSIGKLDWLDEQTAQLSFALPAGCYATCVLRELVDYSTAYQQALAAANTECES